MSADGKEIINKDRVIAQISTQRRKLLQDWLEEALEQKQFEELKEEKDLTLVPCTGRGVKSRKRDGSCHDRRYMVWGILKAYNVNDLKEHNKKVEPIWTLRLNLFHVEEKGISDSAQLVVLQPGKSSIQGLTREKGPNAFSFVKGCLSGPINDEDDLRQQVSDFLDNNGVRFNTDGFTVDFSESEKTKGFKEADDKTSKNIHPQPCVINSVFKKLIENRLVITDKTGVGDIVEQILALDLDANTMQDLLSDFLKYYKKETCLETFEELMGKYFIVR